MCFIHSLFIKYVIRNQILKSVLHISPFFGTAWIIIEWLLPHTVCQEQKTNPACSFSCRWCQIRGTSFLRLPQSSHCADSSLDFFKEMGSSSSMTPSLVNPRAALTLVSSCSGISLWTCQAWVGLPLRPWIGIFYENFEVIERKVCPAVR